LTYPPSPVTSLLQAQRSHPARVHETNAGVTKRHNIRDGRTEWMSAMANLLPMMIVGRIIGVPAHDIDKLIQWGCAAAQVVEGLVSREQLAAAGIAVMELGSYITEQFQHAAANPQGNLLSDLATACAAGELADLTTLAMMARQITHHSVCAVRSLPDR
jgi:cytochrome P450